MTGEAQWRWVPLTGLWLLLAAGATAGHASPPDPAPAARAAGTNQVDALCDLTRQYCDRMHATSSTVAQKELAAKALDCAQRSVVLGPDNARAHLCLAVACVKNFPFVDTRTKVEFSRRIKTEAETAIRLDPKNDVSYYLLGRWHYGVANMNFLVRGLVEIVYGGLPPASNAAAEDNFQKAIQLAPRRVIHRLELAKVYHLTGREPLARAELHYCDALTPVDPDDADARQAARDILHTGQWP
jgi:hypothetical protein